MHSIAKVATALQQVLQLSAAQAGRSSRFTQRQSKCDGAVLVQTLVFGWLANPQASLEDLAQTAATLGVRLSPQALHQRFTPQAAACVEQVLACAVRQVVQAAAVPLPVFQRFTGTLHRGLGAG